MQHFAEIGYALAVLGLICLVFAIATAFSSRSNLPRVPRELRKQVGTLRP